jgi:hypothetical protein
LRAADPIKYSWNFNDPDGYDLVTIPCKNVATAETGSEVIENAGSMKVAVFLKITGPTVGTTTIYNETTDELLTIVDPLRAAESRSIITKAITDGVATLTTSATHTMYIGDIVTISGVGTEFDGEFEVTDIPTTSQIQYLVTEANVASTGATGTASRDADFLEIDTYERQVGFNGVSAGARVMIDTLVDWITLDPGNNTLQFTDEGAVNSTATLDVFYRSGWIG